MKYKLTADEKNLILQFKKDSYPSIYKLDHTDNILFVELVDFDVCNYLLAKKRIDQATLAEIMCEYQRFLSQIDIEAFDEYALSHFRKIVMIMDMFQKYYG